MNTKVYKRFCYNSRSMRSESRECIQGKKQFIFRCLTLHYTTPFLILGQLSKIPSKKRNLVDIDHVNFYSLLNDNYFEHCSLTFALLFSTISKFPSGLNRNVRIVNRSCERFGRYKKISVSEVMSLAASIDMGYK